MGAGGANRNQNCRELLLDRATVPQSLQLKWMWQTAFFPIATQASRWAPNWRPSTPLEPVHRCFEWRDVDFLPSPQAESHGEPALWLQKELTFSAAAKVWLSRTVGAINFSAFPFVFTPGKNGLIFVQGERSPGWADCWMLEICTLPHLILMSRSSGGGGVKL